MADCRPYGIQQWSQYKTAEAVPNRPVDAIRTRMFEVAAQLWAGSPPQGNWLRDVGSVATTDSAPFFSIVQRAGLPILAGTDTVAPGKLADLVLLDANPLADITNTTLIRAVVANGRYFDRAALDRIVAEVHTKIRPELAAWNSNFGLFKNIEGLINWERKLEELRREARQRERQP